MSPATYRAGAFTEAGERIGLDLVRALDLPDALAAQWHVALALDFRDTSESVARLVDVAVGDRRESLRAILAVDDRGALIAAEASARLGLPHNDPRSALAARDKFVMRERLRAGGVPVPGYARYETTIDPATIAEEIEYPCVVKPLLLSGSRGVIRADDPAGFVRAFARTRRIVEATGDPGDVHCILVERFVPGVEVALEGLLTAGSLRTLALFDKPDPLDGPFFEETIYVTPSRLPGHIQAAIATRTAESAAAVGLREGPVHAELRIDLEREEIWMIELAGRSIGGLCSSVLEFGAGMGLEELILRHAAGIPLGSTERSDDAAGVMMIPIPKAGMLRCVEGMEAARAVEGITGIEITTPLNGPIVPLPEGESYLGFIFARTSTPQGAEAALREAHELLRFRIDPMIALHSR
ncbi:MAG: Argininosuccinate lyase [uncultured Thermomicrobiales bacterium]|uniref:Argininosuccinate lyase n=1 Tax=uncultured Thermomicrobiales bacterium TaxID=1645740 RepID=A0A6J4UA78_9BACT|nr:MAG: Argininosuccinate lyase [uncultured Thermomicrobiales bacterium]